MPAKLYYLPIMWKSGISNLLVLYVLSTNTISWLVCASWIQWAMKGCCVLCTDVIGKFSSDWVHAAIRPPSLSRFPKEAMTDNPLWVVIRVCVTDIPGNKFARATRLAHDFSEQVRQRPFNNNLDAECHDSEQLLPNFDSDNAVRAWFLFDFNVNGVQFRPLGSISLQPVLKRQSQLRLLKYRSRAIDIKYSMQEYTTYNGGSQWRMK